jgi:hypothetical protein
MFCETCQRHIDLDFDVEHYEQCPEEEVEEVMEGKHMTLKADEIQRLWEMYVESCRQTKTQASLSDFAIYCEESGYES